MNKSPEKIDDIRRNIAELDELIKADKQRRVSLGLPPERPPRFVKASHARAMAEKAKVVAEVLTSYLRITNDAKALVPFPIASLEKHAGLLTLIKWSEEMLYARYADLLLASIDVIKDEENTYEKVVTQLYYNLDYAQKFLELADNGFRADSTQYFAEELDAIIADYQRHYDEVVKPQLEHEAEVFAKNGGEAVE